MMGTKHFRIHTTGSGPDRAALAATVASSMGGASAKRAGDDFERELDETHAAYGSHCAFARGHPGTNVSRKGGVPKVYHTKKNGVDFVGVARAFPVALEAKSHDGEASFTLKKLNDPRSSERAELDFLRAFSMAGGLAFYLVRDESLGRVYLIGSEHFARLAGGGSVPLRAFKRTGPNPPALVPMLECSSQDRLIRSARREPIWPWFTLFPELSR